MKSDQRVTSAGRLLSTTSIDEFLQLRNVRRGEMSIVKAVLFHRGAHG